MLKLLLFGLDPDHFGGVEFAFLLHETCSNVACLFTRLVTPLHVATQYDAYGACEHLATCAEAQPKDRQCRTPLHYAGELGRAGIAKLLLSKGVCADVADARMLTPLHLAARQGELNVAAVLMESGAHVDACSDTGETPLHMTAPEYGRARVARALVQNGANVDARTARQLTPLHVACLHGNVESARLLLELDSDIHATDSRHNTSLHFACSGGHHDVARVLIASGHSIDCRNSDQRTPLHEAGSVAMVRLLLAHGANIHARHVAEPSTLLHMAIERGDDEVVAELLCHS